MKELSIEEKAKRYDEALTKARNIVSSINVGLIGKDSFEAVFPELKESEDERIRKELIKSFNEYLKQSEEAWGKDVKFKYVNVKDAIAWLEKQHEQKVIIPKFRVGDTIRLTDSSAEYTITDISDGYYHGKGWGLDIVSADQSGHYELVGQEIDDCSDIVTSKPPQVWLR